MALHYDTQVARRWEWVLGSCQLVMVFDSLA